MNPSTETPSDPLLRFTTGDPDEFVERISRIAPGLSCDPMGPRAMKVEICAARLPDLGIFAASFQNFRVRSPHRPFYGVTIPLAGHSEFLVKGTYRRFHEARGHLQQPDERFDARMGDAPLESLQLCFDQAALDSCARRLLDSDEGGISLMSTLDMARPAARSFARYATFLWSEILQESSVVTTPMVARESAQLLQSLLISAAASGAEESRKRPASGNAAGIRRAEEYLMANLANPISIADVAVAAGMSARNLSREFRRLRGTTIKAFLKDRRLEAANRTLLAAEPDETNVTQVALHFGFGQLGRFSADYRNAFGELPSETLAR